MNQVMVIMRGFPGSGKSTAARMICEQHGGAVFSTDDFWMQEGAYKYDPALIREAHKTTQQRVAAACLLARKKEVDELVIVDNTNICLWEMEPYLAIAKENGFSVAVAEPTVMLHRAAVHAIRMGDRYGMAKLAVDLSKMTIHGVPASAILGMMERWEVDKIGRMKLNLATGRWEFPDSIHNS